MRHGESATASSHTIMGPSSFLPFTVISILRVAPASGSEIRPSSTGPFRLFRTQQNSRGETIFMMMPSFIQGLLPVRWDVLASLATCVLLSVILWSKRNNVASKPAKAQGAHFESFVTLKTSLTCLALRCGSSEESFHYPELCDYTNHLSIDSYLLSPTSAGGSPPERASPPPGSHFRPWPWRTACAVLGAPQQSHQRCTLLRHRLPGMRAVRTFTSRQVRLFSLCSYVPARRGYRQSLRTGWYRGSNSSVPQHGLLASCISTGGERQVAISKCE